MSRAGTIGAFDRTRLGQCYVLAGHYMMDTADDNAFLVHGTIQGYGYKPNPHAWVRFGDMVWEPVTDCEYTMAEYAALFNAVERAVYTQTEAFTAMLDTAHFGPWD